jgi:hypothetical protein
MRWPMSAVMFVCIATLQPMAGGTASAKPVVVELFTSEGCSSCPPADRLLAELAKDRHDVLALAFHVTYWNSLGWRDPFSFQAATDRQNDYAATFGTGSVFTPQLIVDGAKSVVGSDRSAVLQTIAASKSHQTKAKISLEAQGDKLKIGVGSGEGTARILLVGFDHEHQTQVGRGENSGRTLIEANIVRSMTTVARWTGLPLTVPVARPHGEDAAVLLQAPDGTIIAAEALGRR